MKIKYVLRHKERGEDGKDTYIYVTMGITCEHIFIFKIAYMPKMERG